MRTQVPADEVQAAALAYVRSEVRPVSVHYGVIRKLAERLDLELNDGTRQGRADLHLFIGQVRRALDKLADCGSLVKEVSGGSASFWKPEAWEARQAAEAARRAEREADRRRWERIGQEMALYGFQSTAGPGKPLQFSHDDWLRIIEAVEAARAAQGRS